MPKSGPQVAAMQPTRIKLIKCKEPMERMEPTRTPKLAPYIVVKDAPGLVKFVEEGPGGRTGYVVKSPEGILNHIELLIEGSPVMIAEAPSDSQIFTAMVHIYVPDAVAAHDKAVGARASSLRYPVDVSDGDLRGGVTDRWGNQWWFSTPGK